MSKTVRTAWTSALMMVALLISGSCVIVMAIQVAATNHQPQPGIAVISPLTAAALCLSLIVTGAWAFKTAMQYRGDYHEAMDAAEWDRNNTAAR